MLKKVEITSSGDSKYLLGEVIDKTIFDEENEALKKFLFKTKRLIIAKNASITIASKTDTLRKTNHLILTEAAIPIVIAPK